jgi:hypothetical protein
MRDRLRRITEPPAVAGVTSAFAEYSGPPKVTGGDFSIDTALVPIQ